MVRAYFVVIGENDEFLFEWVSAAVDPADPTMRIKQLIVQAALDRVDDEIRRSHSCFLRDVDHYQNQLFISAYVPPGPVRLLLMQDMGARTNAPVFLKEAHSLVVKHLASPFTDLTTPFASKEFHSRMTDICRNNL